MLVKHPLHCSLDLQLTGVLASLDLVPHPETLHPARSGAHVSVSDEKLHLYFTLFHLAVLSFFLFKLVPVIIQNIKFTTLNI